MIKLDKITSLSAKFTQIECSRNQPRKDTIEMRQAIMFTNLPVFTHTYTHTHTHPKTTNNTEDEFFFFYH